MFRKAVSIALILVMSLQSVYKLGLVTYFEANREYIAKVLCINKEKPAMHCNGQCYLKKKMKTADQNEQAPANSSSREKATGFEYFEIESFIVAFHNVFENTSTHTGYTNRMTSGFEDHHFRPPSA